MKKIKYKLYGALAAIIAALTLGACGTETHEEIKDVDGQQFLCTWTESPSDPWAKYDYRCEAFGG